MLELFKYSDSDFKYTSNAIKYASTNGHISVLEWFNKNGFKKKLIN